MNAKKRTYLGLGDFPFAVLNFKGLPFYLAKSNYQRLLKQMIRSGNAPPSLTNMGPIDVNKLHFDDSKVLDAYLIPPVVFSPFFAMGVSGFGNSLTLSAGFYRDSIEFSKVECLFKGMETLLAGLKALPNNTGNATRRAAN